MRFCGLGPGDEVPDANTLWDFREALIAGKALDRLFERLDRAIQAAGYLPDGEPCAEIVPEGDAELATGLGEAEKGIAAIAAAIVARTAADLALGHLVQGASPSIIRKGYSAGPADPRQFET